MSKSILSKGQTIDNKYSVSFFSEKKGSYAETYHNAKQKRKKRSFSNYLTLPKLHRTQFTDNGDILEIEILKQVKHPIWLGTTIAEILLLTVVKCLCNL